MILFRRVPKLTFSKRVARVAVFLGIPMVCFELIGIPRHDWGAVLVFALPGTLVGVIVTALLEHWIVYYGSKRPG
jgi:hypothetical protein